MKETVFHQQWPGWRTVRQIGQGGFGAVFEIERDVFGHKEKAALKVISVPQNESVIRDLKNDGYDDSTIRKRMEGMLQNIVREYSLMADMKGCSNIVYCDDIKCVEHANGVGWDVYIKMELLTALPNALDKTVTERQVIQIGADLCRALAYCEQRKVLHRDIKPQNVFVAPDGTYKLGDFGIAKTTEYTANATRIGTYRYMAPEVFLQKPYGSKADIYSLGLLLYWLLNEKRMPFMPLPPEIPTVVDEEQSLARRVRGDRIPEPMMGSAELKRIVLKACAYEPRNRYQNAEQMLADLEAINDTTAKISYATASTPRDETPASRQIGNTPSTEKLPVSLPDKQKTNALPYVLAGIAFAVLALLIGLAFAKLNAKDQSTDDFPVVEVQSPVVIPEESKTPEIIITGEESAGESEETQAPEEPSASENYSTAGSLVEHAVFDNRDCVLSLTEITGGQIIDWEYVYDSDGFFLYRKHSIGSCYSYLSEETMPGTDLNYSCLSLPVTECVGFSLEYQVKELKKGSALGDRNLYLFDGSTWNAVGTFAYDNYGAVEQQFSFTYPMRVEAFATPRVHPDNSSFTIDQRLTDVWVADYSYVAPLGHAEAPISQFALSKRAENTFYGNDK